MIKLQFFALLCSFLYYKVMKIAEFILRVEFVFISGFSLTLLRLGLCLALAYLSCIVSVGLLLSVTLRLTLVISLAS